ncbi:bile acid:sodium symporter [Sinorhizobium psoraleae]|uniref:bile acid:sodium symporter n=1 Tax=Sinorhizobium psoraleae TaxID=520838 RepID=UPI0035E3DDCD
MFSCSVAWPANYCVSTEKTALLPVFCGSKKSLASGVPMANVIFAGQAIGAIVLPLLLFHQIQLMVCAWLARVYAARPKPASTGSARSR